MYELWTDGHMSTSSFFNPWTLLFKAMFARLKNNGWKYCSLICCERKTLFVYWKITAYKTSEQSDLWQKVNYALQTKTDVNPIVKNSGWHEESHSFILKKIGGAHYFSLTGFPELGSFSYKTCPWVGDMDFRFSNTIWIIQAFEILSSL
jgi:hypothetical protein